MFAPHQVVPKISGNRFLSSASVGNSCVLPMHVPNPSPTLDKNLASMGPGILSSIGVGVWRKAPEAFPDSNTTLDTFQSLNIGKCFPADRFSRKRKRHININFRSDEGPVDPRTTGRLTGQKSLCVLLRTRRKKHFRLVNRLVVLGLATFQKSLCATSLCASFWPDSRGFPDLVVSNLVVCNFYAEALFFFGRRQRAPENATRLKTQVLDRSQNLRFRVCCVFGCVLAPS